MAAEYVADPSAEAAYQSEADLERELSLLLEGQAHRRASVSRNTSFS
ncbi:hypothetical protein ACX80Z_11975 [Arthrobacter sp. TMT4-20]